MAMSDRFMGTGRHLPELYTGLAVFLFAALSLVVPSGYSLGAVLLLLAGLGLIATMRFPVLTKHDGWIMVALLAYAAVTVAEAWWDGQGSKDFDKPSRFLLAIPALLWVLRYPPNLSFLWSGFAVGALGAGTWAGWQKLFSGIERAQGHTHVIQFGNLSMLLGVLCLAGLGWAIVQRHRTFWVCLLLIGAMAGILGSLFSGSRGGWIGFPIVLLVLYRTYGRQLSVKLKLLLLGAVMLAGIAVYAVPQFGVHERVNQAVKEVGYYISYRESATSVGARFEMWRGAAILIQEKPIFGWGSHGYEAAIWQLGQEGVIDTEAAQYGHAHNEFIDAFAKRGVIGLIVLLVLYLIPMRLFARQLQSSNLSIRAVAAAGVLLPVTYIDFGLSQAFLTHNSGVMMYAFLLVILWGIHASQMRNETKV